MSGNPKRDRTFKKAYNDSGLHLLDLAVQREHSASMKELVDRLDDKQRAQKANEQTLRIEGANSYMEQQADRERKRSVRLIYGMTHSFSAWRVASKIVRFEDAAVRDARVVKARTRFCTRTFALTSSRYASEFLPRVGMPEERFRKLTLNDQQLVMEYNAWKELAVEAWKALSVPDAVLRATVVQSVPGRPGVCFLSLWYGLSRRGWLERTRQLPSGVEAALD